MLGFFKTIAVLAALAALAYFAFFVPLGDRTLYRHLVGISQTDEAKALKDGLKEKASVLKADVVSKLPTAPPAGAPLSHETDADKRALEKLLERAEKGPGER
jgi:hypothetical protein